MTEPTYQPTTYTPPALRIAATYAVPQVGDTTAPVPGHPDNVEIELHSADVEGFNATFIVAVVESLFRNAAAGVVPNVTVGTPTYPSTTSGGSITYPPGVRAVTTWNADGSAVAS